MFSFSFQLRAFEAEEARLPAQHDADVVLQLGHAHLWASPPGGAGGFTCLSSEFRRLISKLSILTFGLLCPGEGRGGGTVRRSRGGAGTRLWSARTRP